MVYRGAFQGNLHRSLLASLHGLEELYLDDNTLQVIHHKAFAHMSRLRVLSLRDNFLPCLTECDIVVMSSRLASLEILDLSGNVMSESAGIIEFSKELYPKLTRLNLSGNRIRRLTSDMFGVLAHLRELDLSDNPLQILEANSLDSLSHLQTLSFDNCRFLTKIPDFFFAELTRLQRLSLRGCSLKQLGSALSNIKNLLFLDLSQNGLSQISSQAGKKPEFFGQKLEQLDLSFNELENCDFLLGSNSTNLRRLTMNHNRISSFLPSDFLQLFSLQFLDLSHNHLTSLTVDEDFLNLTNRLVSLDFTGNPIYCDCDINALSAWMRSKHRKLPNVDNIRCVGPPTARGELLTEVMTSATHHCNRGVIAEQKTVSTGLATAIFVCVVIFAVCIFLVLLLCCCQTFNATCLHRDVKHERFVTSADHDDVNVSGFEELSVSGISDNRVKESDDVQSTSSDIRCYALTSFIGRKPQRDNEALSSQPESPLMSNVFETDADM